MEKRVIYIFLGMLIAFAGVGVFATITGSVVSHSSEEVNVNVDGVDKSLQDAIDDGDLAGGGGATALSGAVIQKYSDGILLNSKSLLTGGAGVPRENDLLFDVYIQDGVNKIKAVFVGISPNPFSYPITNQSIKLKIDDAESAECSFSGVGSTYGFGCEDAGDSIESNGGGKYNITMFIDGVSSGKGDVKADATFISGIGVGSFSIEDLRLFTA